MAPLAIHDWARSLRHPWKTCEGRAWSRTQPAARDVVDLCSEDSFPCSDPPSWTPVTGIGHPDSGQESEVRSQESGGKSQGTRVGR